MTATSAPEGPSNEKHWCPAEAGARSEAGEAQGSLTIGINPERQELASRTGPAVRGRSPVIAFFGWFGGGNFGNDASLLAARESVARLLPEARLVCISQFPDRVAAEHGMPGYSDKMAGPLSGLRPNHRWLRMLVRPAVEVARWVAAARFLRKVDVLIVPGTGIVDDMGVRPWQMPYDLFRWSLATRLARTKLVYLSVGAGPIHDPISRFLMKRAVGFADYCSYRDLGSRRFMEALGRDVGKDPVLPDLAFTLPRPQVQFQCPDSRRIVVAVGVMSYSGWTGRESNGPETHRRYVSELSSFCQSLLRSGHEVELLIGQAIDETTRAEIRAATLRAFPSYQHVDLPLRTPNVASMADVLNVIAKSDVVVATRFHNIVGAFMMCRPVLSIGYAEKNRELLACAGMEQYSQYISELDGHLLHEQFNHLLSQLPELQRRLFDLNITYRSELNAQYTAVFSHWTDFK